MKRSFILHLNDENESELLVIPEAFSYAMYNENSGETIISIDGEEFSVVESIKEIQRFYEETEG